MKKEKHTVAWKLTEEGRALKCAEAASLIKCAVDDCITLQREISAALGLINETRGRIERLAEQIATGVEAKEVPCEVRLVKHTKEKLIPYHVEIIHPQTGEVCGTRWATDADLQISLFREAGEDESIPLKEEEY